MGKGDDRITSPGQGLGSVVLQGDLSGDSGDLSLDSKGRGGYPRSWSERVRVSGTMVFLFLDNSSWVYVREVRVLLNRVEFRVRVEE